MASFYESLKDLFNPEMTKKIAEVLEEKESDINKAASQIIAGLLAVTAKKGHTQKINNIFEEAGNINLISDVGMFDEYLTHPQQEIGDNFLQHLLGDKAEDFTTPISKSTGLSEVVINRLVSIIAPSFPAFFGKKLVKDKVSFQSIIDDIKAQERSFEAKLPADLIKAFGLGTVLNTTKPHTTAQAVGSTASSSTASTKTTTPEPTPQKKNKNSWITWLFVLIALLLIFFWWRSCNSNPDNMANSGSAYMVDSTTVIAEANPTVSNAPAEVADVLAVTEITLPNGEQVEAYKDGIEEKMVNFLNSAEYKNATAKDLESKWFEFDNIDFEFGSTTELKEGSKPQLDNIIAILKAHKDAKVMVAAFADKKGTETANMRVSKERAQNIEKMLEKAGVGAQVVKTEGYGDTHARYSADAPESDRQKDRDIALRFVK